MENMNTIINHRCRLTSFLVMLITSLVISLNACYNHVGVWTPEGRWKVVDTVSLRGITLLSPETLSKASQGYVKIDKDYIEYSLVYDLKCPTKEIILDTIFYPEEEGVIELALRATSLSYGYRLDRPYIAKVHCNCDNSSIAFERFGNDTLGYYYDGYLFLLTRD